MRITAYILPLLVSISVHAAVLLGGGFGRSADAPFDPGRAAVRVRLVPSIKSVATMQQPQPLPAPPPTPRALTSTRFNAQFTAPLPPPQVEPAAPAQQIEAPRYIFQVTPTVDAIERNSDLNDQGVFTPAQSIGLNMPQYPRLSRRRGEEGAVTLDVQVLAGGRAGRIDVVASSGHTRLDRAAVKAVRASTFHPARRGNKAMDSTKRIVFTFRLDDAR